MEEPTNPQDNSAPHTPGDTFEPSPSQPATAENVNQQAAAVAPQEQSQPVEVQPEKNSFGKSLAKTLLWIVLLVLIGLVGALAAIYIFKI